RGVVMGEELFYSAPLDGKVTEVYINVFDNISKGTKLLKIVNENLELKRRTLEREIADLQTALEIKKDLELPIEIDEKMISLRNEIQGLEREIEVQKQSLETQRERVSIAKAAYERAQYLAGLEAVTKRLAENRHVLYLIAKANIADLEARIANREATLKSLKERLSILEKRKQLLKEKSPSLYSDISITLRKKQAELEEIIKQQEQGLIIASSPGKVDKIYKPVDSFVLEGTHLLKVIRSDRLYVLAYIKPKLLRKIHLGQEAVILFSKHSVKGKIVEISDKMEPLPSIFRSPFRLRENYGKIKILPIERDYTEEIFKPGLQVRVRLLKVSS
ncbi:HlyD family efflux transporter periplasmic adaptor subunit, partial [Candidatus Sumerlaeota bacterium]|nr:HlyD family efflux transporter periplasmic adaptor subunit [Candidatus Sumerlaeota bacterium]